MADFQFSFPKKRFRSETKTYAIRALLAHLENVVDIQTRLRKRIVDFNNLPKPKDQIIGDKFSVETLEDTTCELVDFDEHAAGLLTESADYFARFMEVQTAFRYARRLYGYDQSEIQYPPPVVEGIQGGKYSFQEFGLTNNQFHYSDNAQKMRVCRDQLRKAIRRINNDAQTLSHSLDNFAQIIQKIYKLIETEAFFDEIDYSIELYRFLWRSVDLALLGQHLKSTSQSLLFL